MSLHQIIVPPSLESIEDGNDYTEFSVPLVIWRGGLCCFQTVCTSLVCTFELKLENIVDQMTAVETDRNI